MEVEVAKFEINAYADVFQQLHSDTCAKKEKLTVPVINIQWLGTSYKDDGREQIS